MKYVSAILDLVRQWMPYLWQLVAGIGKRIGASMSALAKSPTVWLACFVVFVGGYATAFVVRGVTIKNVRAANVELTTKLDLEKGQVKQLLLSLARARQDALEAQEALNAIEQQAKPKPPSAPKPAPAKRTPIKG